METYNMRMMKRFSFLVFTLFYFILIGCSDTFTQSSETNTNKPLLALNGNKDVFLKVNDQYVDEGATALDDIDGDITHKIKIVGLDFDNTTEGKYIVTYSVSNTRGVSHSINRNISVLGKDDVIPIQNVKLPWEHGKLKVTSTTRMLEHTDSTNFFWLADTAWYMVLKLDREEVKQYLSTRKKQGFNVILVSAVKSKSFYPTRYKERPFTNNTYSTPNEGYWKHVDFIIEEARKQGLYIALLPAWHSVLENVSDAETYANFIATRYKNKQNVIWVLGGDTSIVAKSDGKLLKTDSDIKNRLNIWKKMGDTINTIVSNNQLITFHSGGVDGEIDQVTGMDFLDFHIVETGHCRQTADANGFFKAAYKATPKPVLDGESRYEDIKECFYRTDSLNTGHRYNAKDLREVAYSQVFSGAFGHTYGHQSVWKFFHTGDPDDLKNPLTDSGTVNNGKTWDIGLTDPGAEHMQYLKKLMESRKEMTSRTEDSSIIQGKGNATRGKSSIFVYLPNGGEVSVDVRKISGNKIKAWWYNPRTGDVTLIRTDVKGEALVFISPDNDDDNKKDYILVIDDLSKNYGAPGH